VSAPEGKRVAPPVTARHDHAAPLDRDQLLKLATQIMPCTELRRYVPRHPAWCRRIAKDVWFRLMLDREPEPSEIQLLFEAHKRAVGRRDREQARKQRRVAGFDNAARGALTEILRERGEK